MCTGVNFCGTCHDGAVRQWADGLTHEVPKFGDNNQREIAARRRMIIISQLILNQNFAGLEIFPEWRWELRDREMQQKPATLADFTNCSTIVYYSCGRKRTTRRERKAHRLQARALKKSPAATLIASIRIRVEARIFG